MAHLRRIALAAALLPLALGLSACGKSEEKSATAAASEPLAKVAPPAGKAWGDVVEKTPQGGYRMGNPDAAIKLVEFGSLTCPHCAEFAEKSAAELRDTFVASGRVSFEFRNFVRDPIDITAAQLTRCGPVESYFALTDQAFANQAAMFEKAQGAGEAAYKAAVEAPEGQRGMAIARLAGLVDFFAARGIAEDQASICLADAAAARTLAEGTRKATEEYKVEGTPTFLINNESQGSMSWEELKAKLEAMGAR